MTFLRSSLVVKAGALLLAVLVASCATSEPSPADTLTIDQVVATPDYFNGKNVRINACLYVTRHGMALFNCSHPRGKDTQLVFFAPLDAKRDEAYQRVLKAGFQGHPEHLVNATLTGVFRFSAERKPHYLLKVSSAEGFREVHGSR